MVLSKLKIDVSTTICWGGCEADLEAGCSNITITAADQFINKFGNSNYITVEHQIMASNFPQISRQQLN